MVTFRKYKEEYTGGHFTRTVVLIIPALLTMSVAIAQPIASFTTSDTVGCKPYSVQFANNSANAVSYFWDFGNGNTSVLENPTNLYVNSGIYSVKLIAYDGNGNADSLIIQDMINVEPTPVAQFSPSVNSVCVNSGHVQFTDNSLNTTSWLWDFGDGDTSVVQHPSHIYTSPGLYSVTLVAGNQFGCDDVLVQMNLLHVMGLPVVDFSADTTLACDQQVQIHFTDLSSGGVGWDWDFGDGNNSNLQNPTHAYNAYGIYDVALSVTDSNGCSNTLIKNNFVEILEPFAPTFTTYHTEACTPLHAYFYNQTPNTMSLLWDYGDSTTSTSSYPLHVYNTLGVFNVSLTVTDSNNCTYTTVVDSAAIAHPTPVADFTLSNNTGCAPLSVPFADNSTGCNAWIWDFGDGDSSDVQHPLHTFQMPGNHTVTLSVFDTTTAGNYAPEGCSALAVLPDTVHVLSPDVQFSVSDSVGCAPLSVVFTDQTQGAVQWFWDFGDGNTSTLQHPTHTYQNPGTYDVLCAVVNNNLCKDTIVKQALIVAKGPDFTYHPPQPIDGCVPLTVNFNSNSFGYNTWFWDFGDGNTSTLSNPAHIYNTGGVYVVSLHTEAPNGCPLIIDTFAVYKVHQLQAGFEMQVENCPEFKVIYTDTSSGGVTDWLWDFGDSLTSSTQNPVHYYAQAGIYSVSLKVSDQFGCQSLRSIVSGVTLMPCDYNGNCTGWGLQGPIVVKGTLKGCNPFEVHFVNPIDSTVSWLWDFGDGDTSHLENPVHTFTQAGYHDVTLITEEINGDIDTIFHPQHIFVSDLQSGFSLSKYVSCQDMYIELTDSSTNAIKWNWNFGDGDTSLLQNPSHTYLLNNANYSLLQIVTDSIGCMDMSVQNVFSGLPNPVFYYPVKVCGEDTVQFSSNLNIFSSYLWDFGDGHTSTSPNPVHVYDSSGIFQVSLIAIDTGNCQHYYILPYPVEVITPEVDFTTYQVTETCFPYHVNLYNLSLDFDSLLWEFGDGDTSTSLGVQNHYYSYGTYDVALTIFKDGCSAKLEKPGYINIHQAVADFSLTQDRTCLPITATLTDLSAGASSWVWSLGDGDTAYVQNHVHSFSETPSDSITLSIVDSNGCQASITKPNVQVFEFGVSATNSSGCVPVQVSFSETQNNAVSWQWDFGDNSYSSIQNPQHTYTSPGIYNVSLIAQSPYGCFDTISLDSFVVAGHVIADFSSPPDAACAPSLVTFNNSSTGADTWFWDFGDNSTSTQQNPSHIYSAPGIYTVTLIASDSIGCADTIVKQNLIEVLGPIASFDVSDTVGCAPVSVQFNDMSVNAVSWVWYFGDGDTSDIQNPAHVYTSEGSYNVSLIVYDSIGCQSVYTYPVNIHVLQVPQATFAMNDTAGCLPFAATFNNMSQNGLVYTWHFGDGDSSNAINASHLYTTEGVYHVSLVSENGNGCKDTSAFQAIYVYKNPIADFTVSPREGCAPLNIQLTNLSTDTSNTTYLWIVGNDSSSATNPSFLLSNPGYYDITLVVTNASGCSDTVKADSAIEVYDTIAPLQPQIKYVTVINNEAIEIAWEPSSAGNFAYYVLYRADTYNQFFPLDTIYNIQTWKYTDYGLNTLDKSYCYKLREVSACGLTLPISALVTHCSMNIEAEASGGGISVSWSPYIGCTVGNYELYRSEDQFTTQELLAVLDSSTTEYTDKSALCPLPYAYKVKAFDLCGTQYFSNSDTAMADNASGIGEQHVKIVRTTVVDNKCTLTEWLPPLNHPELVRHYLLYKSDDDNTYSLVALLPPSATSFLDTAVEVGKQNYFYRVEVENKCGLISGKSNQGSSILLRVDKDGNTNILNWTEYVEWDEGVEYYIIEKMDDDGVWREVDRVSGRTLHVKDK